MHAHRNAHPSHLGFAAAAIAVSLALPIGSAAAQSETQPPANSPAANPPSVTALPGAPPSPAAQTALAIAGAAAPAPSAPPPQTAQVPQAVAQAPTRPAVSGREMTADERRQFMMLLIFRETSRNPIGSLR